jgi:hypothetical protein
MVSKRFSSLLAYFNPFVLAGAIVFGLLLFGSVLFAAQLLRPQQAQPPVGTAFLLVIEASTNTPLPSAAAPTITPQPVSPNDGSAEPIEIGNYVRVSGTGVDGLRMRASPGLENEVRFVAIEAEVYKVIDGPQTVDGYVWWHLQALYDESLAGWAVAQYLDVIQINP